MKLRYLNHLACLIVPVLMLTFGVWLGRRSVQKEYDELFVIASQQNELIKKQDTTLTEIRDDRDKLQELCQKVLAQNETAITENRFLVMKLKETRDALKAKAKPVDD